MLSVLEKLQQASDSTEIWWDSSPLDFPRWRDGVIAKAADRETRARWTGQLDRFLCPGDPDHSLVRGVTTNPSLVAKHILRAPETWTGEVQRLIRDQAAPDIERTFALVYQEAVRRAAGAMLPLWRATEGKYGWVSGQLDPRNMFDADRMLEQALAFADLAPNLMIKVPGTVQGYRVIRGLVSRGISVNGTLSYTVPQFTVFAEAVEAGLREARDRGVDTSRTRAVFTHMIGRFGANDDLLYEAAVRGIELSQTDRRWAELAILKRIHRTIQENGHPVKPLLSSLSVDDPELGSTSLSMHLEQTAGGSVAYTCKPQFIRDTMRREHELTEFDASGIDRPVPPDTLEKLLWLPSFHRAYEPTGMAPEEFAHYGAFVTTYAEVMQNTRNLIDFVTHQFQSVSESAQPLLLAGAAR
ncbi:transaldolase family protein [Streptomyces sp. SID7909]|uniref:transaldolase family protein n=1 Tax=Streptomyces sp. SID7909 TaxID=2706092 RepID=UPI0013BC9EA1|nr:transaldolase family protein [Streptomyces sp. SID7909]NEC09498.1 hypothetical protein [Streptomyces sp. SID7909]